MDYFSRPAASNDQNNSTNPQTPSQTPRFPPLTPAFTAPSSSSRDDSRPLPALRLRRPPSSANFRPQQSSNQFPATPSDENAQPQASSVRRRSSSDPQRSSLPPASNVTRVQTADPSSLPQLASVTEERSSEAQSPNNHLQVPQINEPQIDQSSTSSAIQRTGTSQTERPPSSARRPGLASRMSTAATNLFPRRHDVNNADSTQDIADPQTQYGQDIVDLLDVVGRFRPFFLLVRLFPPRQNAYAYVPVSQTPRFRLSQLLITTKIHSSCHRKLEGFSIAPRPTICLAYLLKLPLGTRKKMKHLWRREQRPLGLGSSHLSPKRSLKSRNMKTNPLMLKDLI